MFFLWLILEMGVFFWKTLYDMTQTDTDKEIEFNLSEVKKYSAILWQNPFNNAKDN